MANTLPPVGEIEDFLRDRHGEPVAELEALDGGFWSSAFAYRVGRQQLVVRFGTDRSGYEADRIAVAFDGPDLPVPEVVEIGDAFDGAYAISVRHYGKFLETVRPDEAALSGDAILRLLAALWAIPTDADAPVDLTLDPSVSELSDPTWRRWLSNRLVDNAAERVSGWRSMLAADAELDALYRACEERITGLLDACPERRDIVHGDLLHQNVLVSEDASRVTAVFSWKCAVHGDFLYDTAWCTFWGAFHPGIAAANVWDRILNEPALVADQRALDDAAERHHCYELHIGARHLAWHTWVGDEAWLRAVAAHTAMILERGPLTVDRAR